MRTIGDTWKVFVLDSNFSRFVLIAKMKCLNQSLRERICLYYKLPFRKEVDRNV